MKKSHKWIEGVRVKCPHCHMRDNYENVGDEGDIIKCWYCAKQFELGERG